MKNNKVICVDGTSAAGKGEISNAIAKKFNFIHFNTGKVYRYLAYLAILEKIDIMRSENLIPLIDKIKCEDALNEKFSHLLTDNNIAECASLIASYSKVREKVIFIQQNFISLYFKSGIIVDGRDAGTTLFKAAKIKFFIIASDKVRAMRRFKELKEKKYNVLYDEVLTSLQQRDLRDQTRSSNPLIAAKDAIIIDTSDLSLKNMLELVLNIVSSKLSL